LKFRLISCPPTWGLTVTVFIALTVPSALAYTGTSWRAASTTVTGTGPLSRSPSLPASAFGPPLASLDLPPPSMRMPTSPTTSTAITSSTIFQKRDIQKLLRLAKGRARLAVAKDTRPP
jgi:hypothetical protein